MKPITMSMLIEAWRKASMDKQSKKSRLTFINALTENYRVLHEFIALYQRFSGDYLLFRQMPKTQPKPLQHISLPYKDN